MRIARAPRCGFGDQLGSTVACRVSKWESSGSFHDIFLPWEPPRGWFEGMQYFWAEEYLLQAFDVLVRAHAISRVHADRLVRIVPSFVPGVMPGSLWLRRSGPRDIDQA